MIFHIGRVDGCCLLLLADSLSERVWKVRRGVRAFISALLNRLFGDDVYIHLNIFHLLLLQFE